MIGIGFFVYNTYFGSGNNFSSTSYLESTGRIDSAEVLGADIIKAINQIDSLNLNREVFSHPVLDQLIDRSEELVPQDNGRSNPFAPIGSSNSPSTDTTDVEGGE